LGGVANISGSTTSKFEASGNLTAKVGNVSFRERILTDFDPKGLRSVVDEYKKDLGSGVVVVVSVNEGRATIAVGVTDDLTDRFDAVKLVQAGVAALGGKGGGGRPDMAQGGGPDGSKAAEAIEAVKAALAG
jgi:alanyl-tRNA synthetase